MNTYKARIKVHGRLLTPLRADTIFGHVAWGIARHEGAAALEEFLSAFEEKPTLVLSSAFPAGCLPMPQLCKDLSRPSDVNSYSTIKKSKRLRHVPASCFSSGKAMTRASLAEAASSLLYSEHVEQALHNTVDRLRGGTLDEVGLFQTRETWLSRRDPHDDTLKPALLDIYILSVMDIERVSIILGWAFEAGFGAKSSSGAGSVELLGIEESSLPSKGNRAMALAPFVPENPVEVEDLRADIFVRHGMLGQELGAYMNPFKKPILFFDEGATFIPSQERSFIGTMVRNVHKDPRICQHGYAPVVWFEDGGSPAARRG